MLPFIEMAPLRWRPCVFITAAILFIEDNPRFECHCFGGISELSAWKQLLEGPTHTKKSQIVAEMLRHSLLDKQKVGKGLKHPVFPAIYACKYLPCPIFAAIDGWVRSTILKPCLFAKVVQLFPASW